MAEGRLTGSARDRVEGIRTKIGCGIAQRIPVRGDRPEPAYTRDSEGRDACIADSTPTEIRCENPQGLPYYADQPIQWPNSS